MGILPIDGRYSNAICLAFSFVPNSGFTYFDPDTIASPNSLKSYLLAVGGSVDAVNYLSLIHI